MVRIEIKINFPEKFWEDLLALAEKEDIAVDELIYRAIKHFLEGGDSFA